MLRSPLEAALNDLHVGLLETADLYRLLSERHEDPSLRQLFARLGARRRERASKTEQFIRRLDGLPDVPDTDWETVEQLFAEAQQAFSPSHRSAILSRAAEHEERLVQAVEESIRHAPEGDVRRFLDELYLETRNAGKRLKEAESEDSGPVR